MKKIIIGGKKYNLEELNPNLREKIVQELEKDNKEYSDQLSKENLDTQKGKKIDSEKKKKKISLFKKIFGRYSGILKNI